MTRFLRSVHSTFLSRGHYPETLLPTLPAPAHSFAYLGGVSEGQDILRALLLQQAWQPGLILALTDETLRDAAGGRPWPDNSWDGIPVVKVPSFQSAEAWRALGAAASQGVLCAGISEILREPFLSAFPLGVYGFHASLLPALAGPAPVNWAIINGVPEIGTTLLRYSRDLDGGTVVGQAAQSIDPRETTATLYAKLSSASAALWLEHWPRIARQEVPERPLGRLPLNLRRRPEDGLIRWGEHSAASLDRWVRGLARPYPGAYFWFQGRRIWVHAVEPAGDAKASEPTLESAGTDRLVVAFPDGKLRLSDLRLDQDLPLSSHIVSELSAHAGEALRLLHRGQRVLVIAAHPDDEVLGPGGTLIRHFKSGDEIRALIVCSSKPIRYREGEHEQPADSQRAAHYLGARTSGLGFPDQRLDAGSNLELIQAVEHEVQEFQPTVVYTHHWGDVNADHVRIAEAVDVATRPFAAPYIRKLYAFETPSSTEWTASSRSRAFTPNVFSDISRELDRKLDAMRCYRSELRPYPHPRSLRSLRERAGYWGSLANLTAAEPFMLLRALE